MNCFYIIIMYNEIKKNNLNNFVFCIVMIGGKVVFGYYMVKFIIKLVNSIVNVVNNDFDVGDKLKVVFLENYRVSLVEKIVLVVDLSE